VRRKPPLLSDSGGGPERPYARLHEAITSMRAFTEDDQANKPELQNPRAVVVVTRVSNKLTGASARPPPPPPSKHTPHHLCRVRRTHHVRAGSRASVHVWGGTHTRARCVCVRVGRASRPRL
jgi:hypothetical protein